MKKYLLILALFPFIVFSQPDNRWVEGYEVVGNDTLLVDSLTGSGNHAWVVTYCADQLSNIDNGYISAKSLTRLNGQPITTLFPVANYADTTFFEMLEHQLASDSTELLPYRLNSISHYNTAVTGQDKIDLYEAFNVPKEPTTTFIVPDNYSTVLAAYTAASDNDTILVKKYTGNEKINVNKSVIIQGLGEYSIDGNFNRFFEVENAVGFELYNCAMFNDGQSGIYFELTADSSVISNCYTESTNWDYLDLRSDTNYITTINKSVLNLRSDLRSKQIYSECYFNNDEIVYLTDDDSKANIYYSDFKASETGAIFLSNDLDINVEYCNFTGDFMRLGVASNQGYVNVIGCNFIKDHDDEVISFIQGGGNVFIDNCTFIDRYKDGFFPIVQFIDHNVTIQNSDFDSCKTGILINNTVAHNFVFDSNNYFSEFTTNVLGINSRCYLRGNYLESDTAFSFKTYSNIDGCDSNIVSGNTLVGTCTSTNLTVGAEDLQYWNYSNNSIVENNLIIGDGACDLGRSHSIFIFNQDSTIVRYNYTKDMYYGTVIKHNEFGSGTQVYGNISDDCIKPVIFRCSWDILYYNNTAINIDYPSQGIEFYPYLDSDALNPKNITLKNNIAVNFNSSGYNYTFRYPNDTIGLITTNNVMYSESDTTAEIQIGNVYSNFATWQALGYDQNSYNTDPNFKSSTELWPVSPSNAIGNGLDLGTNYNQGLNITSTWPDNVVLKFQYNDWTIGAYVVESRDPSIFYYDATTGHIIYDPADGFILTE